MITVRNKLIHSLIESQSEDNLRLAILLVNNSEDFMSLWYFGERSPFFCFNNDSYRRTMNIQIFLSAMGKSVSKLGSYNHLKKLYGYDME